MPKKFLNHSPVDKRTAVP